MTKQKTDSGKNQPAPYYTLCIFDGKRWLKEWSYHVLSTVEYERDCIHYDHEDTRIITTTNSTSEIARAIQSLNVQRYEQLVQELEAKGISRSDAQGIVDLELRN